MGSTARRQTMQGRPVPLWDRDTPSIGGRRPSASRARTCSLSSASEGPVGLPFPTVARTFSRGDSRTDSSSIGLPRHARQRQTAHRAVWTEDDSTAPHQGSSLRLWSLLDPIPAIGPWSQVLFDAVVPRLDLGALEGRAAQPGISSGEVRTVPFCTSRPEPRSRRSYCSTSSGLPIARRLAHDERAVHTLPSQGQQPPHSADRPRGGEGAEPLTALESSSVAAAGRVAERSWDSARGSG